MTVKTGTRASRFSDTAAFSRPCCGGPTARSSRTMRENGPYDQIKVCESDDDGLTWGEVSLSELPNPGAGLDGVVLASGRWLLIYNDTTRGSNSLAVSLSEDEGQTWEYTRHLEKHESGSYHYPAVIQGRDGTIHAVYSYFVEGGKSMKHAAINEAWIMQGDE